MTPTIIELDKYNFIYDGEVKVEFDNSVIDLSKLNVVSVCITKEDQWAVNIITKEAIFKLRDGITKTLETLAFKFSEYMDAVVAHNFLTLHLLAPETVQQKDKDDTNI